MKSNRSQMGQRRLARAGRRLAAVATLAALLPLLPSPPVGGTALQSPAPNPECEGVFCAGAARADITPPVTTPMWGYSARAFYSQFERWTDQRMRSIDTDLYAKVLFLRSEGVHTRLYARALVLRNRAGVSLALVQTDLGAVTGELHQAVTERVAHLGVDRDHLVISATHTHGGPGTIQWPAAHGLLVGDHYDPRTTKRVADGIVRAIEEAAERMAPARIGIGQGRLENASVNRSIRAHSGTYYPGQPGAYNFDPCPDPQAYEVDQCSHGEGLIDDPNHHGERPDHPHAIDPILTLIRVDRADGVPLGAWTNFAAHGTMFWSEDLRFSADNQGFAERMVEEGIAERARERGIDLPHGWEVVAAYANASEGDQAPIGLGHNRFAAAEDSGRRQAQAMLEVYDSLEGSLRDDVELDARFDLITMQGQGGTSPLAILGAGPDCPFGTGSPMPEEGIPGQGRKCPFLVLSGTGPNWFRLQVFRVGDMVAASVPGEITVQMGRRVKKVLVDAASAAGVQATPVIVGLANDYMAYITTPEEYDNQDYEGTFTLWGRNEGPFVRDRIGALAQLMFSGRPNPSFVEPPEPGPTLQVDDPATVSRTMGARGRQPGTILVDTAPVIERGQIAWASWVGGPPSVDFRPDEPFVTTERLSEEDRWKEAFTDESYLDLLDYWREGVEDRWATAWDIGFDAPAGYHRFAVDGWYWSSGSPVRYDVTSTFEVVPTDDLSVSSIQILPAGILVRAAYPPPLPGSDEQAFTSCNFADDDPCGSFRLRPTDVATGRATVVVERADGSTVTAEGSYDAERGGFLVPVEVSSGDTVTARVRDRWDNFTGQAGSHAA
ncbi:MAG: neutral/alkaline non-lysosomal ceramidase N-terminal domain-containing protein [Actinomycetota bacterium]